MGLGAGRCVCPVGLASELTSRGASTTDVMLAGNWKTSRMVAHYSAGATAKRGAGRAGFYAPPRRSQRTEWYNPVRRSRHPCYRTGARLSQSKPLAKGHTFIMFILFDSNVWISQLGLQSENGAAVRYFANRRSATLAIPEVVRIEVEEKLTERLLTLTTQIEHNHEQLLPVLRKLQPIALPTEDRVREAVANIIPNLDVPIRQIPFNLRAARASMMKLLRRIPPSKPREQFRDGVIWEHCLELLSESDVQLVSEDKDFYEHRDYKQGMATELIEEMKQRSTTHRVKLTQNLAQLLLEIRIPIRLDNREIFQYIRSQEMKTMGDILAPNGFELCDEVNGEINCFATEEAEKVYFTFHLAHPCRDGTGAGRRGGELTLEGSGFLDSRTEQPTKVQLSRIRLDYPDWEPGGPMRGMVSVSAHCNAPTVHRIQFPLDSPGTERTDA